MLRHPGETLDSCITGLSAIPTQTKPSLKFLSRFADFYTFSTSLTNMSSGESASNISGDSSGTVSEYSTKMGKDNKAMPMEYEDVGEADTMADTTSLFDSEDSEDEHCYSGEPLADEEWLAQYKIDIQEEEEAKKRQRLEGIVTISSW